MRLASHDEVAHSLHFNRGAPEKSTSLISLGDDMACRGAKIRIRKVKEISEVQSML